MILGAMILGQNVIPFQPRRGAMIITNVMNYICPMQRLPLPATGEGSTATTPTTTKNSPNRTSSNDSSEKAGEKEGRGEKGEGRNSNGQLTIDNELKIEN